MEALLNDLRFAVRTLVKSPLLTGVAVVSLALGIGANTTIFTVINAVFLRALPVEDPARIAVVFTTDEKIDASQSLNFSRVSRPNFESIRDETNVFSGVASVIFAGASLAAPGGEPEQIGGELVTANYFDVFGVEPVLGRGFASDEDETPGADPVVVLSHEFWSRRFGSDPEIVGKTITLNAQPFSVIGVAPSEFRGSFMPGDPDFWAPSMMYQTFLSEMLQEWFVNRRAGLSSVYARLAPDVTLDEAEASLRVLGANLEQEFPDANQGRNFALQSFDMAALPANLRENFVRAGGLLMTVVGLVLLIACGNVANLLLGRAAARRKEIAIRLSMGARRARLVRQLLTESLLLAILGGVAGLLFAIWGRSALWAIRPPFLQDAPLDLGFDTTVLGFTLVLTALTGLVFGLVPALQASRPQIVSDLKPQAPGQRGGFGIGIKNILVVAQVALSLVALVGSSLFLRSLVNATRIDTGFETEKLASLAVDVDAIGYDEQRGEQFFDRMIERASSMPGVESAALTEGIPIDSGINVMRTFFVHGRDPEDENNREMLPVNTVSIGYFRTAGIELRAGRDFDASDHADAPSVAILNETTAARFWPGEDPIGKRFYFINQDDNVREVIGIARDSKYGSVGEQPQMYVYLPRRQNYAPAMHLMVPTSGDPEPVLASARNEIRLLEPNLPITDAQTMPQIVSESLWGAKTAAGLLGLLGALALLLVSIGIYGVMAYTISQQQREIGIRMALGGGSDAVLRLFLKRGMLMVAAGAAVGLLVATLLGRGVTELLYDVSPTDPLVLATTTLTLVAVAFAATLIPARRALQVDPVVVLKQE
jgi:predicted permease